MSEYDLDEPENDPSDEDDWGSNKKKRKKGNQTGTPIGKGRRGLGVANSANSSMYLGMSNNNGNNLIGLSNNPSISQPVLHPFVCQSNY